MGAFQDTLGVLALNEQVCPWVNVLSTAKLVNFAENLENSEAVIW